VSIDAAKDAIRNRSVDTWLKTLAGDDIDVAPLNIDDWNELCDELENMVDRIDESRRMGIKLNGICLLTAYLLNDLVRVLKAPNKKPQPKAGAL
jgi:hypothetical protein